MVCRSAGSDQLAESEAASVWPLDEGAVWAAQADVEGFQAHPLAYYILTAELALGS